MEMKAMEAYRSLVVLFAMLSIGLVTVAVIWFVANRYRNHPIDTIPLADLRLVRLETSRTGEELILFSRAELASFQAAFRARKPFQLDAPSVSTYCKLRVETLNEAFVFPVSPFHPPDIFNDMDLGRKSIAIDVFGSQFWISANVFRDAEQAAVESVQIKPKPNESTAEDGP